MRYNSRLIRKRVIQTVGPPLARILQKRLRRMSWTESQRFGARWGRSARHLASHRFRYACENLKIAVGDGLSEREVNELGVKVFAATGKLLMESLRLPVMEREEVAAVAPFGGLENLDVALALGQGALLVSAHLGNWELTAARVAQTGYPLVALARPSSSRQLAEVVEDIRREMQVETVSVDGGVRPCLRVLGENKVLGLLPDQRARGAGLDLPFFGRLVNMWHTPVLLSRRSGAPLLLAHSLRQPDGRFVVSISPPLDIPQTDDWETDVKTGSKRLFTALESLIRAHPTQYLWQYDLFREAPPLAETVPPSPTA